MSAAGDQWQPPQPRPGSVAYSLMQSKRASMAPSSMHRRTDSNDSAFSASPSWNAAGFGAAQRSPETSPQHDRSFSSGGQSSHVSKPSLSGEFMKELRASRISFNQSSSNSKRLSRPGNALQMPRLGQNGWRGSVVGDPFQDAEVIGGSPTSHWRQGHGASASMSSSLRNEYTAFGQPQSDVRDSIFSGDDISGAVSMIRDDQPASAISKKRQSQYSNSPSDSPPLATASRADPRRILRHSGYFSNTPQQQHQLRESTYSEDSAYTQPNASASFFAASRSPLTQSPQGPNLTPDDALAAYTARQTAQQQQPSALTQSAVGGGGVKGLKAKGKMANLFKKNSQAPPDPTPLSPDSSSLSPSLQERA